MYDVTTVRAIAKNKELCNQLAQATSDSVAESLIQQNQQVINNTVSALKRPEAAPTSTAPVSANLYDDVISAFIKSIASHSASLTQEVVKEALSKHPEWAAKYEAELSKGADNGRMYLQGNLDLIEELFAYI